MRAKTYFIRAAVFTQFNESLWPWNTQWFTEWWIWQPVRAVKIIFPFDISHVASSSWSANCTNHTQPLLRFLLGVWNFDYGIMVPIQQNMLRAGFNTYYMWHLAWIYNFCVFVYVGFAWAQLCDKYEKRLTCKLTLRWPVSFKALLKCYLHPASCWRSWLWSWHSARREEHMIWASKSHQGT